MPQKAACDACRKRKEAGLNISDWGSKVQCCGSPPPCTRCKHNSIPCTFNHVSSAPSRTRISSSSHSAGESLSQRIERIEQALASAKHGIRVSGALSSSQEYFPRTSQTPSQKVDQLAHVKFHFAGHFVGHIGSFTGIPFISETGRSWIDEHTGTTNAVSLDALCSIGPDWQASLNQPDSRDLVEGVLSSASDGNDHTFPTRRTAVEYFFALYCSSSFSRTFSLVEPVLFRNTLDIAYGTSSDGTAAAKAYVVAFLLFITQGESEWNSKPAVEEKDCERKIKPLIISIIGQPDVSSAEAFLMLAIYYFFHGREEKGLVYHAIACRHLLALGAHVDPVHRFERAGIDGEGIRKLTRQHLRRLFWVAYWSDGELSLRTGRPPAFDDDYCDLTLPSVDGDLVACESNADLKMDPRVSYGGIGMGVVDLQLAIIKSHVGRGLYSSSALRKTDAETLRDVRELDDQLECWRMSIPEDERPTLASEHNPQLLDDPSASLHVKIRKIFLQFHYLHLLAKIHQASSRCRRWTQAEGEADQLRGISSSIAISLHASRATLNHVRLVLGSGVKEGAQGMLFYPVAAVLNIFCNVLLDPLGPLAAEDLNLIRSASDLIRELSMRSTAISSDHWFPHFNRFIIELVRLAQAAMDWADKKKEKDTNN